MTGAGVSHDPWTAWRLGAPALSSRSAASRCWDSGRGRLKQGSAPAARSAAFGFDGSVSALAEMLLKS